MVFNSLRTVFFIVLSIFCFTQSAQAEDRFTQCATSVETNFILREIGIKQDQVHECDYRRIAIDGLKYLMIELKIGSFPRGQTCTRDCMMERYNFVASLEHNMLVTLPFSIAWYDSKPEQSLTVSEAFHDWRGAAYSLGCGALEHDLEIAKKDGRWGYLITFPIPYNCKDHEPASLTADIIHLPGGGTEQIFVETSVITEDIWSGYMFLYLDPASRQPVWEIGDHLSKRNRVQDAVIVTFQGMSEIVYDKSEDAVLDEWRAKLSTIQ